MYRYSWKRKTCLVFCHLVLKKENLLQSSAASKSACVIFFILQNFKTEGYLRVSYVGAVENQIA